jgi:hypothetical protein
MTTKINKQFKAYYVYNNKNHFGPFTVKKIKTMLADGHLDDETLVSDNNLSWFKISEVPAFNERKFRVERNTVVKKTGPDQNIAIWLCLLLGQFGIHKLYLKQFHGALFFILISYWPAAHLYKCFSTGTFSHQYTFLCWMWIAGIKIINIFEVCCWIMYTDSMWNKNDC